MLHQWPLYGLTVGFQEVTLELCHREEIEPRDFQDLLITFVTKITKKIYIDLVQINHGFRETFDVKSKTFKILLFSIKMRIESP